MGRLVLGSVPAALALDASHCSPVSFINTLTVLVYFKTHKVSISARVSVLYAYKYEGQLSVGATVKSCGWCVMGVEVVV